MMKYAKPEVTRLGSAFEAVQSDMLKPAQIVFENPPLETTKGISPAYEADE